LKTQGALEVLDQLMEKHNISQSELGRVTGVPQATIPKWTWESHRCASGDY